MPARPCWCSNACRRRLPPRSPLRSPIPTIGIGAGADCDGQVLVLHDLLGLDSGHRRPKFVKDFLAEGGSVAGAVRAFADAVRDGSFLMPSMPTLDVPTEASEQPLLVIPRRRESSAWHRLKSLDPRLRG